VGKEDCEAAVSLVLLHSLQVHKQVEAKCEPYQQMNEVICVSEERIDLLVGERSGPDQLWFVSKMIQ